MDENGWRYNMIAAHLFPFELIEKNSRIVIYGAGNVGREYMDQLEISHWCEILFLVDKNYDKQKGLSKPVCNPTILISEKEFDYIVIAIDSKEIVKEVEEGLISLGVAKNKIISTSNRTFYQIYHEKDELDDNYPDTLRIGFGPIGGLGDYVIALCVFEEIIRYAPQCKIDVFGNITFGKAIYGLHPNVNTVLSSKDFTSNTKQYDIVIEVEHVVYIHEFNYKKTQRLYPELAECLKQIVDRFTEYHVNISMQQYRDAIWIKRAELRGLNRYTILSHDGIFSNLNQKVNILFNDAFLDSYNDLGLKKYITINRGADDVLKDGRMQVKVWPKEYYEEFITAFKKKYPVIEVLQLGGDNSEKIDGVDRYLFGKEFELVKYILKSAIFHLDCEGGLVHLASQIGTKCVVLFGPTPIHYYSYENNINIVSEKCNNCMGVTFDWYVKCYRGMEKQECMYSITPQIVMERIGPYMMQYIR